ncbi:MAG: alkaline phosphatase family protein [Armatimonadetes bacterium]|nr:alkaline phosphatase family protein [Armatimonadota bacterium]
MLHLAVLAIAGLAAQPSAPGPDPPRLTVVISIDQFRSDYLRRFSDLFLPAETPDGIGGFRWLIETGADFVNSKFTHVPTYTGPGHAVIGTGSPPGLNGIVGNGWFDRAAGESVYCVSDPDAKDVLTGEASYSPKNLRVTTFGDELKIATGGKSKHVSIGMKDRASILLAGRMADVVIWRGGDGWTTSTFYAPDGKLPEWVVAINGRKLPASYADETWTRSLPDEAYERTSVSDRAAPPLGFGKTFPHKVGSNFHLTPRGNEFLFETAKEAVRAEWLGRDEIPDILTLNLSTNDYVGHSFGPDSPEVLEITVATDRQLADFFRFLDDEVSGGIESVFIVVTSDHGVLPIPEELTKRELPGGRVGPSTLRKDLDAALEEAFGSTDLIAHLGGYMIYIDIEVLERPGVYADAEDVQWFIRDELLKRPQIHSVFTRYDIMEGFLSPGLVEGMLAKSFHKENSGDVFYFLRPGYLLSGSPLGTSHGSPWPYDTAVPLLMRGRWVRPGRHLDACGPVDIAATVCAVLGVGLPSGNVGRAVGLK